jgi:flavin reductase (DIM6/NTAB) family NADH-FMN oxidoreductase RutF
MAFKEIDLRKLQLSPFEKIGKKWMLATAEDEQKRNTTTASWGGLGVIWDKDAATAHIRQNRCAKELMDEQDTFSLSFFGDDCRDALALRGKVSGRDADEIADAGLAPSRWTARPLSKKRA